MKKSIIFYVTLCFIVFVLNSKFGNYDVKANDINIPEEVEEEKLFERKVTLTTYNAVVEQTDSTPNLTASGFEINLDNPKKHRIIAISRDLKKHLEWGEKVILENAGKYSGVWYVRDLMNPRFKNKIDVLINEDDKHTKLYGVVLKKLD